MGISLMITIFLMGVVGSFISGMLGIGGAIINYPMLVYIPFMLGVGHFSAHEVSGITSKCFLQHLVMFWLIVEEVI